MFMSDEDLVVSHGASRSQFVVFFHLDGVNQKV